MKTALDAANHALIYIGQEPLESLADNPHPVARRVNILLAASIKEVLRAHPWNFAIKTVTLDPLAEAPAGPYARQYQKPVDWIRTLETSATDFRRQGDVFLADTEVLTLRYICTIDDLTKWDALAAEALARNLAHKMAYALTASSTLTSTQWELYQKALAEARAIDAQEEPSEDFEESSLISVRR